MRIVRGIPEHCFGTGLPPDLLSSGACQAAVVYYKEFSDLA
jgi:hypothetical protein